MSLAQIPPSGEEKGKIIQWSLDPFLSCGQQGLGRTLAGVCWDDCVNLSLSFLMYIIICIMYIRM